MKRNLSNITADHTEELKRWISKKYGHSSHCPFAGIGCMSGYDPCSQVFPSLNKGMCPCAHFSVKYVKEIARLVIHKCQQ